MVKDTAADGASARMRIQAMTGAGTKSYAWRTASGNGNVTRETTYLYDSSGVKAVRIQVCRHAGSTDTCSWSPWRYNDFI
ncbi:hypothetical protein [Streptomyces sp. NPDC058451]|uniref:hypothetical protein n=1 Tax=Streptomyces sp. NPDC058451 TaxID=3346506 RepID=UPI003655BC88